MKRSVKFYVLGVKFWMIGGFWLVFVLRLLYNNKKPFHFMAGSGGSWNT